MLSSPGRLYQRLSGDRYVKGLAGFQGRRLVKARSLLPRRIQPRLSVRRGDLSLLVTNDPLDAEIIESISNRHRDVYFPAEVGDDGAVELVVEVGAHHGVYTAAAAKRYPNARFVAIEPALDALLALRDQIAHNRIDHRVEVVPAAISSSAGISTLSHEASGSWGATLAKPEHAIGTETVATLTLQQVLRGRHPDLIKCNAEGAEFELIPQLEQLPTKPRILIVAVHPGYGDVDSLRETTTRMGYEIRVATDGDHPMWVCVSDG